MAPPGRPGSAAPARPGTAPARPATPAPSPSTRAQRAPGGAPPPGRPPPPVWLIVWVAAACQWLRGYMSGLFYGARVIIQPAAATRPHPSATGDPWSLPTGPDAIAEDPAWRAAWASSLLGCSPHSLERVIPMRDEAPALASELALPLAGALLAGWLTKRFGRRAAACAGIGLMALALVIGGVTSSYPIYFLGYGFYSAGAVLMMQVRGGG
jgi:hypothetical protein